MRDLRYGIEIEMTGLSGGDPGGIFWNAGGTHRRQL